jgi:hypothetical protein
MKIPKVKFNSEGNVFHQLGILLLGNKMVRDYYNSVSRFPGTGPEDFAEAWLKTFVVGTKVFKDDITRVFITMLQERKSGK